MSTSNAFDFLVQWHLTERCNLRCTHCYQTGEKGQELSERELNNIIEEISSLLTAWGKIYEIEFSPSVNITGGEPLLRPELFTVLSEFRHRGFDTYLLTNGILATKEKAKRLSHTGVKGVQVSIEGPEQIHDTIRGKNSFAASLRGVRNLLETGLKVTLNMTLSRLNAGSLMETIDLARNAGVQRLGFSRLVPSGRGRTLLKEMLETSAVQNLYEKVFATGNSNGLEIVTGDPVASQFRNMAGDDDPGSIPLGGCAAGVTGITIMPDGSLLPCRRLPIMIGNVKKDSLREIWAVSDVLNALRTRDRYSGKCRSCSKWANCRGCRAIAYAYSHAKGGADFLAPDPQCFL